MYDFSKNTPLNKLINIPFWFMWGVWIVATIVVERFKK